MPLHCAEITVGRTAVTMNGTKSEQRQINASGRGSSSNTQPTDREKKRGRHRKAQEGECRASLWRCGRKPPCAKSPQACSSGGASELSKSRIRINSYTYVHRGDTQASHDVTFRARWLLLSLSVGIEKAPTSKISITSVAPVEEHYFLRSGGGLRFGLRFSKPGARTKQSQQARRLLTGEVGGDVRVERRLSRHAVYHRHQQEDVPRDSLHVHSR